MSHKFRNDVVGASSYGHFYHRWRADACSRARVPEREGKLWSFSRRGIRAGLGDSDRRARRHGGSRAEAPFPRGGGRRRSRRRRRSAENKGHRARRRLRGRAVAVQEVQQMCEKGGQGAMHAMSTRVVLHSRVPEGGVEVGNLRVLLSEVREGATTGIDATGHGRGDARASGSRTRRGSPQRLF